MQYQRVALYRSFRKEVDLHDLIAFLPRHSFYYPLVDSKTKLMEFYPYLGEDGFKTNAWGLSEPERVGKPLVPEASDLIVVPAIAFDQQGHRLGYGQGYYDRFLAGRNCATLGICLSEFLVETLPSEPHDQRVNAVMTELGLCLCHCP